MKRYLLILPLLFFAYTQAYACGLSLGLCLGLSPQTGDAVDANTELNIRNATFPVTIQRNSSTHSVAESFDDVAPTYAGTTYYVSPSGSDSNDCTDSSSNVCQSISRAQTVASDNDIVSFANGTYAMTNITKTLKFVLTSGASYAAIGTFDNLQTAQIDATGVNDSDAVSQTVYNVDDVNTGETFQGFIRLDGTKVAGASCSAYADSGTDNANYQRDGIMSVFKGAGSSANFSLGTAEDLQDLVDAGDILAWSDADTDTMTVATAKTLTVDGNFFIASDPAGIVLNPLLAANVYLNGVHVCGGGTAFQHTGSGVSVTYDTTMSGSSADLLDYKGTVTFVEVNNSIVWPGEGTADNASTAHEDSTGVRVGGVYRGGSRTIHDVNNAIVYNLSLSVGDSRFNDKLALVAAFNTISSENVFMDYGDITFLDTFSAGDITNTSFDTDATVTNTDLEDAWPYNIISKSDIIALIDDNNGLFLDGATGVTDTGSDNDIDDWADQSTQNNDLDNVTGTPDTGLATVGVINAIQCSGSSEQLYSTSTGIISGQYDTHKSTGAIAFIPPDGEAGYLMAIANGSSGFGLYLNGSNQVVFTDETSVSGKDYIPVTPGVVNILQWTYDQGTLRMAVNSVENAVQSHTYTFLQASARPIYVCNREGGSVSATYADIDIGALFVLNGFVANNNDFDAIYDVLDTMVNG